MMMCADCCATYSEARQDTAVAAVKGYCRQRTLEQLLEELKATSKGKTGRKSVGGTSGGKRDFATALGGTPVMSKCRGAM